MKTGPKSGASAGSRTDYVAKATAAYGGALPDWVEALARAANRTGAKAAAEVCGYSGAVISTVFSNSYRASLDPIEAAVRGAFMRGSVRCPFLQRDITGAACVAYQKADFPTSSPTAVQHYYACRAGCPHATGGEP